MPEGIPARAGDASRKKVGATTCIRNATLL